MHFHRAVSHCTAIVNPEQEEETEVWDESELEEFTSGVYEIPAELDTFINSTSTSEKYSSEEFIIMGRNREAMLLFDLRQTSSVISISVINDLLMSATASALLSLLIWYLATSSLCSIPLK